MNLYILNEKAEMVGINDGFKSLIWSTRYYSVGDFELYTEATKENIKMLRERYLLCREKDIKKELEGIQYKNVMIIEKIQVKTDVEEGNFLIVTGRCLKSIVHRRIVWQQTTLYGKVEMCIRQILNENVINPVMNKRKIQNLVLGSTKGFSETMDMQVTGKNIGEWIEEVCNTYGMGWDICILNGKFIFRIYKGEDRSYKQTENPTVMFSGEFDNLARSDYELNLTMYKNVVLIGGEGEGLERKYATAGDAEGLERREMFADARNQSTNNGAVGEAEYMAMLIEQGNEVLEENKVAENIEGEINQNNYKINEDYFLGDIVEVITEHGIETTPRIIEIIDSIGEDGELIVPIFSTWEL